MRRVLIGGTLCILFGSVFVVGGLVNGHGNQVVIGIPGILLGVAALLSVRLNDNEPR
jgi:hypothetical protein